MKSRPGASQILEDENDRKQGLNVVLDGHELHQWKYSSETPSILSKARFLDGGRIPLSKNTKSNDA